MDPCAPTREHIRGQIAGSSVQGSRPNGMRRFFRSAGDAFKWPRLMTSSCGRREAEWRRARYTCRRASGLASGRWRALEPWNRRDPHAPQRVRVCFGSGGDTRPDALNVRFCCADAESRHSAFGQTETFLGLLPPLFWGRHPSVGRVGKALRGSRSTKPWAKFRGRIG